MSQLRLATLVLICLLGTCTVLTAQTEELSEEDTRQQAIAQRFADLLERTPRRGTALDRLYGFHVERGTLPDLVDSYRQRTEADPNDGTAWMILGLLEAQRGQDAAAVIAFRQAQEKLPEEPLASYYLGQALVLVGQPDAAAQAFEECIKRKPSRNDLLEAFQALGRVYQRSQRHDEALKVWDRLESIFPDDLRVKEQIATTLAEEGQHEQALKRFEELVKLAEGDDYRQVSFQMQAADLQVRLGKQDDALARFEKLLGRLKPDSWLHREVRRKIEEVFLRNDNLEGLATYYEKWIEKNPEDIEAISRLAWSLSNQGRAAEAMTWYEKALERAPSNVGLRLSLIEQLVHDKQFDRAVEQYEKLDEIDRNNPDYIREWGLLILKDQKLPEMQRREKAVAVWKRLIEARPNDAVIVTQVADLLRQAKLTDQAIELYQRAIKLRPQEPQFREYLGEYFHELERTQDALATWKQIAEGENRSSKNLARLAEVLSGFGYKNEAVEPIAAACELEPDHFAYRMQHGKTLLELERFDDALREYEAAKGLAESSEEKREVLTQQIVTYQLAGTLQQQIESQEKQLAEKPDDAASWLQLALYLQADRRLPEATAAIRRAINVDQRSIEAWTAAAEIFEMAGDLMAAADANRKLATLDRRFLTEYLTDLAGLEMRLGRRDKALQAGRDLIVAAPGNPEHYQSYASLCFQLGEEEEAFDALRRSVRVNPSDVNALQTLAQALSDHFRTDEAIELYWRAYDSAQDLEGKLNVVSRLAELYLRTNHLDRLLERLQRQGREEGQERETTICLAQAYHASGDFTSAKQELRKLLTDNTRDTQLLLQLASLSEAEGDRHAAAEFLERVQTLAPSDEVHNRLAKLYIELGENDKAQQLWSRLAEDDQAPHRVLQAVDGMLTNNRYEAARLVLEKRLRANPSDWESLFREGYLLASLEQTQEAAERFRAILEIRKPQDEQAVQVKAASRRSGQTASYRAVNKRETGPALKKRIDEVWMVRFFSGLDSNFYYSRYSIWTPSDFGQARMAALAWLYSFAEKQGEGAKWVEDFKKQVKASTELLPRWDSFYLSAIRNDHAQCILDAKELAQSNDPEGLFAYLQYLAYRSTNSNRNSQNDVAGKATPLPDEDLQFMIASYEKLRTQKPDWIEQVILQGILEELKLANRTELAEKLFREAIESANTPEKIQIAFGICAQRGDIDAMEKLAVRLRQLAGKSSRLASSLPQPTMLCIAMNKCATEKRHQEIFTIIDLYLDSVNALRHQVPAYNWQRHISQSANQPAFTIQLGKSSTYVRLEYPQPNDYYDLGALQILRNAYALFERDDLYTDLLKHFTDSTATDPKRQISIHLGACYLNWWKGDRQQASEALARAVALAPNDQGLVLELASLKQQLGDLRESLALVDSIEPLDQTTMKQRETYALHLAVLTGDVQRARAAAERLFGLRLDAETQTQLASQMHQLGMHDMAEAVLNRARRYSGNRTGTLVGLMGEYQRQGDNETAIQIAHQILRGSVSVSTSRSSQEDGYRQQALQVLARSGKLKDLIDRAKKQADASPTVPNLLLLAHYYKAAGDREKAGRTFEALAETAKDNPKLRYQIADQMRELGQLDKAIDHYTAAIRADPTVVRHDYYRISGYFRQANKLNQLIDLLHEIDLRKLGQSYIVNDLLRNVMQDRNARQQGFKLFHKAWESFPNERSRLLNYMYGEVWQDPQMYVYAKTCLLPTADQVKQDPWYGVNEFTSYDSEGRVFGTITRLLETASLQNKLHELQQEIEEHLTKVDGWLAGKTLMAVLHAKLGRVAKAREILEPMVNDENLKWSNNARRLIAQEIENYADLHALALTLYEGVEDGNQEFEYSAGRRLLEIYKKAGREEDVYKLLVAAAKAPNEYVYDPGYSAYRKVNTAIFLAGQFNSIGRPVDAIRLYNDILGNPQLLDTAKQWYGNTDYLSKQLESGLETALNNLNDKTLSRTLDGLLPEDEEAASGTENATIDLILLVRPPMVNKAEVLSLFWKAVQSASGQPQLFHKLKERLSSLSEKKPNDLSVAIARALIALAQNNEQMVEQELDRLLACVEDHLLDPLSEGVPANSRQREQAFAQIGLWVVAQQTHNNEKLRSYSQRLTDRALEAASRQSDNIWQLAILRELGAKSLERGDREAAERYWSRMLDAILGYSPDRSNRDKDTSWHRSKAAPFVTPPASSFAHWNTFPEVLCTSASLTVFSQSGGMSLFRGVSSFQRLVSTTAQVAQTIVMPVPTGVAPSPTAPRGSVITQERFEQAAQLALMATDYEMYDLSLRAIQSALRDGPPIIPISLHRNTSLNQSNESTEQVDAQIEKQLMLLDRRWDQGNVPPQSVYEVLALAVFPEGRSREIFLYPCPVGTTRYQPPRSVGALLVKWAKKAEAIDDLRNRLQRRVQHPQAELMGKILLAQLEIKLGNRQAALEVIDQLHESMSTQVVQPAAELISHVGLSALKDPQLALSAVKLLDIAANYFAGLNTTSEEPLSTLCFSIARHHLQSGDVEAAREQARRYLDVMFAQNARYAGDYSVYRRLQQVVSAAEVLLEYGDIDGALPFLGELADGSLSVTRYGITFISTPGLTKFAMHLASLPADKRFELLSKWSLPTKDRLSVRSLAGLIPEQFPPNVFADVSAASHRWSQPQTGSSGVFSTLDELIASAQETGQLPQLTQTLKELADQKVENAHRAWQLAVVKAGNVNEILPSLRELPEQIAQATPKQNDRSQPVKWEDYMLARACVEHDPSRDIGIDALSKLAKHVQIVRNVSLLTRIRRDLAESRWNSSTGLAPQFEPNLRHWSVATLPMNGKAYGMKPWWMSHEGVISHLNGSERDYLHFKYPITGSFEIEVDIYDNAWAEGELGYGGLTLEVPGHRSESIVRASNSAITLPFPRVHRGKFSHWKLEVRPEQIRWLVNGHVAFVDKPEAIESPWFCLVSNGDNQTHFKNLRITGDPVIPSQVELLHPMLRGWSGMMFSEQVQSPLQEKPPKDKPDWYIENNELYGKWNMDVATTQQSHLAYHRPLQLGEELRYEFYYEPSSHEVHPTLDRLAFLLDPKGVRLHWMVGNEGDWHGLKPDNVVELDGAAAVPLNAGQWNTLRMNLSGRSLHLFVNDQPVLDWELPDGLGTIFGFFHYKDQSTARVRNVVLTGDWPSAVTAEMLENLFAPAEPYEPLRLRRQFAARGDMPEEHNALDVYRHAMQLEPEQRLQFLWSWVLPNDSHYNIRLYLAPMPAFIAPAAPLKWSDLGYDSPPGPQESRLAAPARLLIDTAAQLGQLDKVLAEVAGIKTSNDVRERERLALLAYAQLVAGQLVQAEQSLVEMYKLVAPMPENTAQFQRWALLFAGFACHDHPRLRPAAHDILLALRKMEFKNGDFDQLVRHVQETVHAQAFQRQHGESTFWQPVSFSTYESISSPPMRWSFYPGELRHHAGHAVDVAYFAVPMRGDFQVECELTIFGYRESMLGYNGQIIGVAPKLDAYKLIDLDGSDNRMPLSPPLKVGNIYDYKLQVSNGKAVSYVNGRKIHERSVTEHADPWLFSYSPWEFSGSVRHVRVSGNPKVPEEIHLTAANDLAAWRVDYFGQDKNSDDDDWFKQGEEIHGKHKPIETHGYPMQNVMRQGLLQYHRPMFEDGQIEYQFFYSPGKFLVHPALDRMCFILHPDGVNIHWLAGGNGDSTGLPADNLIEEPENRRGSAQLPLVVDDWNTMTLRVTNGTAVLVLNGQEIYERPLEAHNRRIFGLMHFSDQSAVRVRNVVYRGGWPKSLTGPTDDIVSQNPASRAALTQQSLMELAVDFKNRPVDTELFRFSTADSKTLIKSDASGLLIQVPNQDNKKRQSTGLDTKFTIEGDFEATVEYEILHVEKPAEGYGVGAEMYALVGGPRNYGATVTHVHANVGELQRQAKLAYSAADGARHYPTVKVYPQTSGGKLRLVRKGNLLYYLFAEVDGEFQLLDEQEFTNAPLKHIRFGAQSGNSNSAVELRLTSFTIRAEKLPGLK